MRLSSSLQRSLFEQDSQKKQRLATCDLRLLQYPPRNQAAFYASPTVYFGPSVTVVPCCSNTFPPTGPKRLLFSIPLVSTLSVLSTLAYALVKRDDSPRQSHFCDYHRPSDSVPLTTHRAATLDVHESCYGSLVQDGLTTVPDSTSSVQDKSGEVFSPCCQDTWLSCPKEHPNS